MNWIFLIPCLLFSLQMHSKDKVARFYNAQILSDHRIEKGELWISKGKIIAPQKKADVEIDAKGSIIAPGYIDLQINGGFGFDFSRNPEKVDLVAKKLPKYGVTAFLPTVISSKPEQYRRVLPLLQPRSYGKYGAAILGIHLEGPFFSGTHSGAHNPDFIVDSYDEGKSPEEIYGNLAGVKIVTLAPEIPGGLKLVQYLRGKNILVAAGHSNATYNEMQAAIVAGVGFVTHLFNAMPSFHHRNPGIVGAALLRPKLPYSIIADGVHLHDDAISLCSHCHADGLILVTDAMEALGLAPGKYQLGTMEVDVDAGKAYLTGTKTIAGSVLSMDLAVRKLRESTGCSNVEALEAASLKPAQLLDLYPAKGSLKVGADADFLLLDEELQVKACYIEGELAWSE